MKYSEKCFGSEAQKQALVNLCEAEFEARLDAAIAKAGSAEGLKTIGLSGPTCSGKTTAAKKLVSEFSALGRNVHVISIDDFFKDSGRPEAGEKSPDFDSIEALDLDEFLRCVDDIFEDRIARIPRFDFITGKRSGYIEMDPDPTDLYIFEGIQAVYPEITQVLHGKNSKSIYICVQSPINVGGVVFEPNEIRLMRRIVRDSNFRGASPEYTMYLWEGVRANEEKNIFPNASGCDISIDSTIPYEINVLSQFLRPLLSEIEKGSKYYKYARELTEKIEGIESIPSIMIPDGSIYYEFIKNEHIN